MESRAFAFAAGLFTLALGAAVVVVALWFTGETETRESYVLESRYPVTGLNPHAAVRFRGVDVGRVEAIEFDPENVRSILIHIRVRTDTPVTRGTYARLGTQGVTGIAFVMLDDDGGRPERLEVDAAGLPRIPVRQSFLDGLSAAGEELVAEALRVVKRLDALLSGDSQTEIVSTLAALRAASARVGDLARAIEPVIEDVPALTDAARKAIGRADVLLDTMGRLMGDVSRSLDEIERAGTDTLGRVTRSAQEVEAVLRSISGAAVADTLPRINSLMDELGRNSRSLERLLQDLQDRPESLLFGRPAPPPGPGEPGFDARRGGSR
jgi:phospholipid/cholesterol/gamma-HCH transport system substrate-binding protein